MEPRLQGLLDWIRTTARAARGLLVPVSGGSDSALCFWVCCQAFPGKALAAFSGQALRCRDWFESIGRVELLPEPAALDQEVMRWAMMLARSKQLGCWLVGTRNRTEDVFGTYSMASRVATYLPLAGLWKSEVMTLCRMVRVPAEIIASSTRADPDCGRSRQMAEIPFEWIDQFLRVQEGEATEQSLEGLLPDQLAYLTRIYQANQFKGLLPTRAPRS